jgi:hypothetical protein
VADIAGIISFIGLNVGICDLHQALSEKSGHWHIDAAHLSYATEKIWAICVTQDLVTGGVEQLGCRGFRGIGPPGSILRSIVALLPLSLPFIYICWCPLLRLELGIIIMQWAEMRTEVY